MRKKMKKPFAYLLILMLLMSSVCNRGLFVSAESMESSEPDTSITIEEAVEDTSEASFTSEEDGAAPTLPASEEADIVAAVSEENQAVTDNNVLQSEAEAVISEDTPEVDVVEYAPVSQPEGVYVKAYAAAGILPEDAAMTVTALEEGSAEHSAAEEALAQSEVQYDGFKALDISFYDAAGNVIEPEDGTVQVQIELDASLLPEEVNPESLAVQHLDESTGEIAVQTVAEAAVGTVAVEDAAVVAEFSVESFSTFTISWKNDQSTYFTVTVHHVDKNGVELSAETNNVRIQPNKNGTVSYNFSDYVETIDNHVYLETRYGSISGDVITGVNAEQSGTPENRVRTLTFVNEETTVETLTYNDENVSANVYMIYKGLPSVSLSQSVSGDVVSLYASTRNFTDTPTLTWTASETTDAVVDLVNHTVTWNEDAPESATITITVTATNTNTDPDEVATAQIVLTNEKYTITYDANTSQGATAGTYVAKDISGNILTYRAGEVVTVLGNDTTKFTNSTYPVFTGWSTSTGISNKNQSSARDIYTPGQKIVITGNMTLYGMWAENDATVSHVDIRVDGVTFTRQVQIVDPTDENIVISTSTQTFTGKVTRVLSGTVTHTNGTVIKTYTGPYTDESYEFNLGNLDKSYKLSEIGSVVIYVDITGDDGTVLKNQRIEFTQAQIYSAWANCDGGRDMKGMDFDITGANISLDVLKIPAKLVITKDFAGLTDEQLEKLSNFQITVVGKTSGLNETVKIDGPVEKTVTVGDSTVTIYMSVETDGTYVWALTGLPSDTYTVTESGGATAGEYQLNKSSVIYGDYSGGTTDTAERKYASVELDVNEIKLVGFTNTYGKQKADLTITKDVAGATVPEGTTFTFDIYEVDADVEKDDPVATIKLPTNDNEWRDTVSLEVGEYIIVESDGEIANYHHVSTKYTYTGEDGEVTDTDATVNVELPVGGITVECENTYERIVNDLSITKAVEVENNGTIDVSKIVYSFEVKASDTTLSGSYQLTKTDGTAAGTVTFVNGTATVTITGTDTVVIKNLPTDTYVVTEMKPTTEPSGYYFDETTILTGNATLTEDKAGSVTITNKYLQTRIVNISKTVTGSMGDTNKEFNFTIKVNDELISGTYGNVTITNGKFTLADGESLELSGFKKGDRIEIIEDDYSSDGYTTVVNDTNGRTYTNEELTDVKTNVSFVNTKDISAPTGIFRNIFPFVMMLVIAIDAAVIFFVMYMRRRRY